MAGYWMKPEHLELVSLEGLVRRTSSPDRSNCFARSISNCTKMQLQVRVRAVLSVVDDHVLRVAGRVQ